VQDSHTISGHMETTTDARTEQTRQFVELIAKLDETCAQSKLSQEEQTLALECAKKRIELKDRRHLSAREL